MNIRTIGFITIAVVFVTGIWIITTILNVLLTAPHLSLLDKIALLENPDELYYITYTNASLITILTVAMFSGFYFYCKEKHLLWSIIAFSFIPIYGFGNLFVYLSQLYVVPNLVEMHKIGEYQLITEFILSQFIQDWSGSAIGYLNGISYGILGIPSIIFSLIFIKKDIKLRIGGLLLLISGVLSIIAVIGLAFRNQILIFLLVLSGFIYFIALIFIGKYFLQKTGHKAKIMV